MHAHINIFHLYPGPLDEDVVLCSSPVLLCPFCDKPPSTPSGEAAAKLSCGWPQCPAWAKNLHPENPLRRVFHVVLIHPPHNLHVLRRFPYRSVVQPAPVNSQNLELPMHALHFFFVNPILAISQNPILLKLYLKNHSPTLTCQSWSMTFYIYIPIRLCFSVEQPAPPTRIFLTSTCW